MGKERKKKSIIDILSFSLPCMYRQLVFRLFELCLCFYFLLLRRISSVRTELIQFSFLCSCSLNLVLIKNLEQPTTIDVVFPGFRASPCRYDWHGGRIDTMSPPTIASRKLKWRHFILVNYIASVSKQIRYPEKTAARAISLRSVVGDQAIFLLQVIHLFHVGCC